MNSALPNAISLEDWQLIKVSGADNEKYLQGQITADVTKLTEQNALFAAHCDATGKMWSNLLLFRRGDDIFYIIRKSVATRQIAELKKYAIFSKVTIEPTDDLNLLGLQGIPNDLAIKFSDNNCITENGITSILLPSPYERIIQISPDPAPVNALPSKVWKLLDMQAGYPIIDEPNMQIALPQACNLQAYNAISFDKGCYCGQEMVARAQYRGINKRGLYLLIGQSNLLPEIGDHIVYKMGENWREGGTILAAEKDDKGQTYIQLILNNDMDKDTQFRVKGDDESHLSIR
ncbi:tRNA-modifying protein YgfZ [Orbaceae bacterium ESL0721]|nr:tRNA-modifying protein YgfZ [Orbaceae bacterium ESL0721]